MDSQTVSTAAQVLDTTSEAPAATTTAKEPAAAPADDKISPKLALLIQRERAAVERERAAKAVESKMAEREKAIADREARLKAFEDAKSPMEVLKLKGLTYEDATKSALADGNVPVETEIRQLREQLGQMTEAQKLAEQQRFEQQKSDEAKQNEATIASFKEDISSHLKENAARYELIAFEQCESLVYDVIDEHFERTRKAAAAKLEEEGKDPAGAAGEIMTIAQAADKVEAHLEKKYDKARELAKIKVLLAPRQVKEPVVKPLTPRQEPKTLTNQVSATPEAPRKRPVTDEERIQRAIAYARGLRP